MRAVIIFLFAVGLISALHIVAPLNTEIKDGDIIYIGEIGPGQTIPILIDEKVTTGGTQGIGGIYDIAAFDKVPPGWTGKESEVYAHPLEVFLTADPQAKEGEYLAKVRVVDENKADDLSDVTFWAKVKVTYDVMDATVQPSSIKTGPGQPARFEIIINNKGATGDAFVVSAKGAKRWEFTRDVFVPAQSTKIVTYEIVGDEEATYNSQIAVVSKASPLIHAEKNVTVDVRSNILGDMKATNNGVVMFPILESLIYSFFGLISNLY